MHPLYIKYDTESPIAYLPPCLPPSLGMARKGSTAGQTLSRSELCIRHSEEGKTLSVRTHMRSYRERPCALTESACAFLPRVSSRSYRECLRVLTESVFHHLFEVMISVSVCLLLRGVSGSDRALGMGEMGRANRTNRSNRCNRSNNKVCEGCTYIDRVRRELSVAVACPLWLDRWKLGRARVAAVRGMGARARSG